MKHFSISNVGKIFCLILALNFAYLVIRAQSSNEVEIKRVVEKATSSSLKRDLKGWQSTWVTDATASRTFAGAGGFERIVGWDSIIADQSRTFKNLPILETSEFHTDSFNIHQDNNLAVVDYKQVIKVKVDDSLFVNNFREYRTLSKVGGQWKIVSQLTVYMDGYSGSPGAIENQLNTLGYSYLTAKKAGEAIEVFKLNVKLFPNSSNVYDSLGEAYLASGDKGQARANYQKSVDMDPKNANAIEVLKKLK